MEEAGVGFFIGGDKGGARVAGTVVGCGCGEGWRWGIGTGEAVDSPEGYMLVAVSFCEN